MHALLNFREQAPFAARAHPTEEHYLPLLVAVGASTADESRQRVEGGMTYGVLSMDSFGFGLPVSAVWRLHEQPRCRPLSRRAGPERNNRSGVADDNGGDARI